ncbi:MAG: isochorismatase family protein [Gammaproteobacteria bacterium]|nr:isochorismatase family protein [Gammaproteobacteria bacterium]
MCVLAVPEKSQLLFIDPISQNLDKLGTELAKQTSEQFRRLSAAADLALVPRYFAISAATPGQDNWLSTPCEKNKPRVFQFGRDRPVWSNEDMLDAMRKEDREQLFVCGFWLDDVVTAAALEAQPMGFDTHVVTDLSIAHNQQKRHLSLDRLNQYCIVPIPLQNLLYEWTAKTDDDMRRKELRELWHEQRIFDRECASTSQTGLS